MFWGEIVLLLKQRSPISTPHTPSPDLPSTATRNIGDSQGHPPAAPQKTHRQHHAHQPASAYMSDNTA
ncbi:hypothetical protein BOTBODRAFT_32792 [Botryobasidium botryosum FD-172 SS1]|uniref:Uncharacterized protein n=1 Tax=Botryobasidium botryosum (strain FD-172 SS1) TaxID=930990 RepID=A0A067MI18_BOTB1|nr:hypothetical protein BOTBODRAFT_32792 [Botryobasidium botryosum FD-172 SS1]